METLTIDLVDFRDALNQAEKAGGERHVLLGNGFSIGAHEQFRYGSLFEQARRSLPNRIEALFDRYGTTNFETILRQLDEGQWLAEHYRLYPRYNQPDMSEDYEILKEVLIEVVGAVHPDKRTEFPVDMLSVAASFVKNFDSVFTTCYDLLLYWVMLQSSEDGSIPFQDGFGWRPGDESDSVVFLGQVRPEKIFVHFLHGALHLTTHYGEVHKLTRRDSDFEYPIVEQIRDALEEEQYPLVVSEGSHVNKKERIESSSYLSWVFGRFERINDHLFTYGTAFADEDQHLRDAIVRNSKLTSLFVGVFGDVNSDENRSLVATCTDLGRQRDRLNTHLPRKELSNLEVIFYDSAGAQVWGI